MPEALDWLRIHWPDIVAIGLALQGLVSLIIALTPTKRDDNWWRRLMNRLSFLKPINVPGMLSMPGKVEQPPKENADA